MRILHARAVYLSAGFLILAMLWFGVLLLALPAQAEQRMTLLEQSLRSSNDLPGIVFHKWVASSPANCAARQSTIEVTAGSTVYFCYEISNSSAETVTLTTLLDDNDSTVVIWSTEGRRELPPLGVLSWADPGVNLIRPITFQATSSSIAAWTIESGGNAYIVESDPPATIQIVQPKLTLQLTVAANTPICSTALNANVPLLNNTYGRASFCLTIINTGNITLTQHLVSIPALGIHDQLLTATLAPINSTVVASRSIAITYNTLPGLAWTANLNRPIAEATLSATAIVTSTTENNNSTSGVATAAVTGPRANIIVQRFFADRPDQCSDDLSATGRAGVTVYYCVIIQNTSASVPALMPLTAHEIYDTASGGRTVVQTSIGGGERLTVTNAFLAANGLPQILGPVSYRQAGTFPSQSIVTSTNSALGHKTSNSASASIVVSVLPLDTATPTPTPPPTFTPWPTATPIPPPPIPTLPPTFTPAPTWTPSPTVVIITTPGGQQPTPYPQLGAGSQVEPTADPFIPPVDPAAATATAAVLFGLVPPADPAAATAQALAGVPPVDPAAATATAAVLFGLVPPADPAAATAQALAGVPPVDPAAATATAAVLFGLASPSEAPAPAAMAILPPGISAITVTATATPELVAGPTQRPIAAVSARSPGDAGAVFRSITGGAFWSLTILGTLAGGVLFLLLMGALAGFSIAGPTRNQYDLVDTSAGTGTIRPPPPAPLIRPDTAAPAADNTEWPDTLP